jgi:hypothetical protein
VDLREDRDSISFVCEMEALHVVFPKQAQNDRTKQLPESQECSSKKCNRPRHLIGLAHAVGIRPTLLPFHFGMLALNRP